MAQPAHLPHLHAKGSGFFLSPHHPAHTAGGGGGGAAAAFPPIEGATADRLSIEAMTSLTRSPWTRPGVSTGPGVSWAAAYGWAVSAVHAAPIT